MKISRTRLLAPLVGLLFAGGCASVLLTDHLPLGDEKGYVEFFCDNDSSRLLPITQLLDGREIDVGNTGSFAANKRRRVACVPGASVFFIKPRSCVKRVDVAVNNGMVTPVRLTYRVLSAKGAEQWTYADAPHLDIDIAVQPPTPVGAYDLRDRNNSRSDGATQLRAVSAGYIDSVNLVPQGRKAGWVEFRNESTGEAHAVHADIRYCDPMGEVSLRESSRGGALRNGVFFDERARNIFACPVGTNRFLLSSPRNKARGDTPVQVFVREGMVTPVSLRFIVQRGFKNDFADGFWRASGRESSEPDAIVEAVPDKPRAPTDEFYRYIGGGNR